MCVCVCLGKCVYVCMYMHALHILFMCECMHVCTYVHMYVYTCMYAYVCIHVHYVCVLACMFVCNLYTYWCCSSSFISPMQVWRVGLTSRSRARQRHTTSSKLSSLSKLVKAFLTRSSHISMAEKSSWTPSREQTFARALSPWICTSSTSVYCSITATNLEATWSSLTAWRNWWEGGSGRWRGEVNSS